MPVARAIASVAVAASALAAALPAAAPAAPTPIGDAAPTSLPGSIGGPATARPIAEITRAPQHPFFAANPNSNLHNDPWMTDAYTRPGPLGRNSIVLSNQFGPSVCGSITFDRRGRIVTVCPSATQTPKLRLIDPRTLDVLATYEMPSAPPPPGTPIYQNFTGGGYFFLDRQDRVWSSTATSHLLVLKAAADSRSFVKLRDYDLTKVLTGSERVSSALADWKGLIWFVTKSRGRVGVLDPATGRIRSIVLNEEIENSFAVDAAGVYIASDKRMYRFGLSRAGTPRVVWKATYRNSGISKPGQVNAGTGTTPTLMANGLVSITDNADPMNVVVYRRAAALRRGQKRQVCATPVFRKGASATENSLLSAGRALIVENNYGYRNPLTPEGANVDGVAAGFARVDVNRSLTGCRVVWTNTRETGASVVPKLSTATGLVYTYTRDKDPNGSQPWYFTALDFRTGRTAFKRLAGTGFGFNNNYAGVALGPDGKTAYLGVFGGIVALRDTSAAAARR